MKILTLNSLMMSDYIFYKKIELIILYFMDNEYYFLLNKYEIKKKLKLI